jgi:hypothetical protein
MEQKEEASKDTKDLELEKLLSDAAAAIKGATFLLFCTGAGFSADSGLAVYK